jgi:CRP-like cAMP-binding protein
MSSRLSPEFIVALGEIKSERVYSKGTTLFTAGVRADGVYLLESGEVSMFLRRPKVERRLVRLENEPGAILGLSEAISGEPFQTTAEASQTTTAAFVSRAQLLDLLNERSDLCQGLLVTLSNDLQSLYHKYRGAIGKPGRPPRVEQRQLT